MILKLALGVAALFAATCAADVSVAERVVCYYDTEGNFRKGDGTFSTKYLAEAVPLCDYLIYGYAAINKQHFTIEPLFPLLDIEQFHNYQEVVGLKKINPNLRVLLSVGGGRDHDHEDKYTTLLEYPEKRTAFIHSATSFVRKHGFDGLDLAWQFPKTKPKVTHSGFWSSAWSTIKKPFVSSAVDKKADEHKHQFTELVSDLKKDCQADGLSLTLSVLPNVNSTWYFDIPHLIPNLDIVTLWAFDYITPERSPKEASSPAPLFESHCTRFDEYGEFLVNYWCENGAPSYKIFLGIPTFTRTWKVTKPDVSCIPPIADVDGPGLPGPQTKEAGLLSYPEVFHKLKERNTISGVSTAIKEGIKSVKHSTYALFCSEEGHHKDTWAGFEDPDTVQYKASFARNRKLGGVAIVDLTLDDFKGECTGVKYPLLRAVSPDSVETIVPPTNIPSIAVDPDSIKTL